MDGEKSKLIKYSEKSVDEKIKNSDLKVLDEIISAIKNNKDSYAESKNNKKVDQNNINKDQKIKNNNSSNREISR